MQVAQRSFDQVEANYWANIDYLAGGGDEDFDPEAAEVAEEDEVDTPTSAPTYTGPEDPWAANYGKVIEDLPPF